jgi:hypothetical protein
MNSHATSPRVETIISGKSGVASVEKLVGVCEKKCDTGLLALSACIQPKSAINSFFVFLFNDTVLPAEFDSF